MRRAMASATDPAAPLPDRVPVMCQLSLGHYFLQAGLPPWDVWFTSAGLAEAMIRLADRYRFDGILINLPGRDPDLGREVARVDRTPGRDIIHWKAGGHSVLPHDDNAHFFRDDGTRYFPRFAEVDPDTLHYVDPWDVTDITYPYTWGFDRAPRPREDFFPSFHLDPLRIVKERVGDRLSVHAELFSPFSQFLELLNYEAALMALMDDPAKSHACLERLTAGAIDLALRQAGLGPDAILISSAFAGAGLISREHYEEFVLPYERRLVEGVKARHPSLPVYTHTCGAIGDRLELMLDTGIDGIDTLDPKPLGTVDLSDAKETLRGRAFIKGNLDPVETLLRGSTDAVRAAVEDRLRGGMAGGGYVLSSACSVAPATPPANLALLAELAERDGRY